jgi:hypothetical protein
VTNKAAAGIHRRLDAEQAEALARDGGELVEHAGPLLPPGGRRQNVGTLGRQDGPKVLLMTLSERTSARGTKYLAGWLAKARAVAFLAKEPDAHGNPVWNVYVSEPDKRP